jgi:hypothetical protein
MFWDISYLCYVRIYKTYLKKIHFFVFLEKMSLKLLGPIALLT